MHAPELVFVSWGMVASVCWVFLHDLSECDRYVQSNVCFDPLIILILLILWRSLGFGRALWRRFCVGTCPLPADLMFSATWPLPRTRERRNRHSHPYRQYLYYCRWISRPLLLIISSYQTDHRQGRTRAMLWSLSRVLSQLLNPGCWVLWNHWVWAVSWVHHESFLSDK